MLIEKIGVAAMLEQTAEESAELAQACLKMARLLRKENPVYSTKLEIIENLSEEMADVLICLQELLDYEVVKESLVEGDRLKKLNRMANRVRAMR